MSSLYFDNAATTRVKKEVIEAMLPFFTKEYGNPSSMYTLGRGAKRAIDIARDNVANLINANSNEIYFTSGGTESDNTAIKEIAEIAHNYGIIFHTDAVQACGNIPIDVKKLGIDMLSLSSHKLYGPKGIGALYVKNGVEFESFINGGHQEKGKRAGTENVAGIVGLGKACKLAKEGLTTHIKYLTKLRDYYILEVERRISNIIFNGPKDKWGFQNNEVATKEIINKNFMQRLPGNANFSFLDIEANTLLLKLDQKGISASSASACSTGNEAPSHVLTAIGRNAHTAKSALRVTFGEDNTIDDIDYLIKCIEKILKEK